MRVDALYKVTSAMHAHWARYSSADRLGELKQQGTMCELEGQDTKLDLVGRVTA